MISAQTGFSITKAVTRPDNATAYTANDVVGPAAAAIEFPDIGNRGRTVFITGTRLLIESTGIISGEANYDLHLYSVTPPSALADNAAFDLPSGDRASYLGKITLGTPVDIGSTLFIEQNNLNKGVRVGSGSNSLFGYLVTTGAYTPTALRVYNITLIGFQA